MPMNGVGTCEGMTAGMSYVDSSVCLSGCFAHDDGCVVNGSITIATC